MQFRKDLPEMSGSKNFLKLKDKESVVGVFMGEPHDFFILWENNKPKTVSEGTSKAAFRFRINLLVKEGTVYQPKIFENGATVYRQLGELHDEYGLDTIFVKITRNGTSTETTYSILPSKQPLTKEISEHLKTIPLLSLSANSEEEIPF